MYNAKQIDAQQIPGNLQFVSLIKILDVGLENVQLIFE